MPTFKNKPNKFHKDKDGNTFWESRSIAVEAIVLATYQNKSYVLIEKRSAKMMDSPNLWCVPCGYLDYDETGWEAVSRELFEETGLDLSLYEKSIVSSNGQSPFNVITSPSQNRQNVVLEYCVVMNFDKSKEHFPKEIEKYKNKEIAEIRWMPFDEVYSDKYEWAFNHDDRIKDAAYWWYHYNI